MKFRSLDAHEVLALMDSKRLIQRHSDGVIGRVAGLENGPKSCLAKIKLETSEVILQEFFDLFSRWIYVDSGDGLGVERQPGGDITVSIHAGQPLWLSWAAYTALDKPERIDLSTDSDMFDRLLLVSPGDRYELKRPSFAAAMFVDSGRACEMARDMLYTGITHGRLVSGRLEFPARRE